MLFYRQQLTILLTAVLGGLATGAAAGWAFIDSLPDALQDKVAVMLLVIGLALLLGAWLQKVYVETSR